MNTFGRRLRMHILGESHGMGVGVVLDGVPPGIPVDEDRIRERMQQRRPGSGPLVSSRQETDEVHLSTGVFRGRTTGAPLTLWILNEDVRSQDYEEVARKPRPGHSDWVAREWADGHNDPRGGGHYSGRLTAPLVAAAALLDPLLDRLGVRVGAHLHAVHDQAGPVDAHDVATLHERVATSPAHTAHADLEADFIAAIETARKNKDSVGGVVAFRAEGLPVGLGDPFFDPVESVLAHLFYAVPAVKGVSFGAGFDAVGMHGSEHNDPYALEDGQVRLVTNHAGGILGGRTTGEPVWGHVAIKPTSSIFLAQDTVDLDAEEPATLELKGRHDPCIAVRAVPVLRACTELALVDLLLLGMQQGHVEVPRW